jgi:TolB-like protein/DNA-binding winged helix-turn-helix (wHTH) protein/Flp pilus assembly protein TadD
MADTLKTNGCLDFGPYRLDTRARVLLQAGTIVPLTPKVLDTLVVLVESAGRLISKDELLQSVWPDTFVEESNLAQNISVLRKALGQLPGNGPYIETIAKRGYRFIAEVRPAPSGMPPELTTPPPQSIPSEALAPRAHRRFTTAAAIAALVISAVAGLWYWRLHSAATPRIRSLAVLPLKNLSGDPQQEYIAAGVTELLTTELAKVLSVRVNSRTSTERYRNPDKPIAAIARELNVDAIIEGSVVRSGDRIRVTAQLIQASTDQHLWAETYDRELTDVLLLQEEIARAVARQLRVNTAPANQTRVSRVNRNAFEAYLRARYYLGQRSGQDLSKALTWYEKSIEEDPAYAAPYAGLADCYNQLGTVMIGERSPLESRKLAIAAANRALEIDPDLAEAHAALAYSNLYEWHWEAAEQGFQRAIRLNPNYASAHLWLAHYQSARGNFDSALQQMRLASDLDPLSPIIQTQIAWILGHARRYPEAIQQYRKVLTDNPTYQWAVWAFGDAQIDIGNYDAGIETLKTAVALSNRNPSALGALGRADALAGRRREAQSLLDELVARSRKQYVTPHAFVHIYIGLGDRDKAFEWLEKSYQEKSNSLIWLGVSAMFDPIRPDPRFDDLLRRIGLK